jgi:hypothetical protein
MRLLLFALLAVTLVGSAAATDFQIKPGSSTPLNFSPRTAYYCNGTVGENAFYQWNDTAYGNAYDVGVGGPLSYLDFFHNGYGLAGPYEYHVVVYDSATCTQMCDFGSLFAGDAAAGATEEIVDVCAYNCFVTGAVIVALRPMTCLAANDCYPDLMWDATGALGCGSIIDYSTTPEGCFQVLSANGIVDFLFGIYVDECPPTATESTTWGSVKGLYR